VNQDDPTDFDVVPISLKTPMGFFQNAPVFHFLKNHFIFSAFLKIIDELFR
jgi:hypothetical protein